MTKSETNIARKPRSTARTAELEALSNVSSADDGANAHIDGDDAVPQRTTKTSIVLDLLRREQGALLTDIVTATGWQPHTARAALTGLKKKGHAITSTKVDKVTCYKLA